MHSLITILINKLQYYGSHSDFSFILVVPDVSFIHNLETNYRLTCMLANLNITRVDHK